MENNKNNIYNKYDIIPKYSTSLDEQGLLTCSVCNNKFEPNDDTKYITMGGYTCSWKCFLSEINRRKIQKAIKAEAESSIDKSTEENQEIKKEPKKRGRPKKVKESNND